MSSQKINLLDGAKVSEDLILEYRKKIEKEHIRAKISVLLVGNNRSSEVYVAKKKEYCSKVGIEFDLIRFSENVSELEILSKMDDLNKSKEVTGILIQLPLPNHLCTKKIINAVIFEKDVDGLTDNSRNFLAEGREVFVCCAPKGILKLLDYYSISLKDKKVVLVGEGFLVGYSLHMMLKNRGVNVKVCDKNTENIEEITKDASILISATGQGRLINASHVKKGAVVIDAGSSEHNSKIIGDVDFDSVKRKASWITPVPGGVGPVTVAMLIENILLAYEYQKRAKNYEI